MRELLIGEAIVVPTEDARTPWLICAPTMRVPMKIRTSINAYLAMKAILIAAREHRSEIPIESVAVPGLGTGIGQLAPELAAAQMAQAYREVVLGETKYPGSFAEAQRMHLSLNRSAMIYE
jgi:O-acetyl-ADP-ribose deacetylase (regulator of RNase III)